MLAADLQKSESRAIFAPNALALRFAPRYNLQRDLCQEPATAARIEAALQKITGQKCQFRVESTGGDANAAQIPAAADAASAISRNRRQRAEVEQVPLLKRAFDVLEAQIVHVDEGFGAAPVASPERADSVDLMTETEEG
jgi:hypothetical protein